MLGCDIAMRERVSEMWVNSVVAVFMNFRRAGVLKKRFRTSVMVPGADEAGFGGDISSPCASICAPSSAEGVREVRRSREIEAIDASASPRKPNVSMAARSLACCILLVVWG